MSENQEAAARCGRMTTSGAPCQRRVASGGPCRYHDPSRRRQASRINARGDVLCTNCRSWLPAHRFRTKTYPSRPVPLFWPYCRDCTRELDRLRWCGERRERANQRRLVRQRQQQRYEQADRRRFVAQAIGLLRRRGLTKAEIVRLTSTSWTALFAWEWQSRTPTPNAAERFVIVLRETAHWPLTAEPVVRRRLPHPQLAALMARVEPQLGAVPLRSRWREVAP